MSIDNDGKGGGYNIGHGKPPKEYQFKKGKSGNPKGRRGAGPRASGKSGTPQPVR